LRAKSAFLRVISFYFGVLLKMTIPYVPVSPNAYDLSLMPPQIGADYFQEYLGLSNLSKFMGAGDESPIIVKSLELGDENRYASVEDGDYEHPTVDYDDREGSEETIKFTVDSITPRPQSFGRKLYFVDWTKILTPVDIFGQIRSRLLRVSQKNLIWSLLGSVAGNKVLPTDQGIYNQANQKPGINRCNFAGVAYDPTWAGINAGLAAMATGVAYNQNGLSFKHLDQLKQLAEMGGMAYEAEKKITPYMMKSREGFQEDIFVYLMDPACFPQFQLDPVWVTQVGRGMIESSMQPSTLSGSRFKGMLDGIMVYSCPELAKFRITTGGHTYAWNMFMGAGALGLLWAKKPWFTSKKTNAELDFSAYVHEIRGQKPLLFPSISGDGTNVENGLIHSFIRLT
jgi:hypothetical protein